MIITLQTLVYFRESLISAVDRLIRPYYTNILASFGRKGDVSDDEDSDDQVFAEFDEERGVVFYPPMYLQRYAAVSDCLLDERWCGNLEKVVDLGYHDMSFIKYLKEVKGIQCILGVDIESIPLRCSSDLIGCDDYAPKRENPLQVTLFEGNAADPDYRLIGCDAVIAIEMIEHMLPHDLDRLVHTVFGFIRPWITIFTTPNGDFNVLFKTLEKNGLRRWDHFFEWSREQFHDWCSNIVTRYPEYTVTCKGIGPGPSGTEHLGCCSQMALFISKDYHKQQDLDLNSLALVAKAPNPNNMSDLIGSWETLDLPLEIAPANNVSFTELYSEKQSCMTLVLSPAFSIENLEYHDKTSQCNLDIELGRNYLMFDYEQMCFNTLMPRRKVDGKVYVIEDVASRLNCTTLQANKFSKTTQNILAKNKTDSLVHTREVVDEIRQLTKMLNFNKNGLQTDNGNCTWCNINWGDNAPYWNQYFKIVREYIYPFETKSEECRILDLISDEINRLIDTQFDDELSVDTNKLEIPITHLMAVVKNITDDVDKVKDLLEWNGYVVIDDVVIHSRLVVDNTSLGTQEDDWQDNDTCSDRSPSDVRAQHFIFDKVSLSEGWLEMPSGVSAKTFRLQLMDRNNHWESTDVRSTSISDGSINMPDFHGRCLRRALDLKVRKLRTMLTADQDVTTELDRIVCRLMKLALRTSRGRQQPPPTRWMQCKLLDLLTLTEKAIERRKRYFIENYPLKAINFGNQEKSQEMIALDKIKDDDSAWKIVNKYRHLVQATDNTPLIDEDARIDYKYPEDDAKICLSSPDFLKEYDLIDRNSPSLFEGEQPLTKTNFYHPKTHEIVKLKRTQAWLEDDVEIVPYPDHRDFEKNSIDTDYSASKDTTRDTALEDKKALIKYKPKKREFKCILCKKSSSNYKRRSIQNNKNSKEKISKTALFKKVSRKNSSYNNLVRNINSKYIHVDRNNRHNMRKKEVFRHEWSTAAAKPIPTNYDEIFDTSLIIDDAVAVYNEISMSPINDDLVALNENVSATEKSHVIEIITESTKETIALRRTIGTDAEGEPLGFEEETLIRSVSNTLVSEENYKEKQEITTENVQAQTIFIFDINEPTTSKGIRHFGMDVQCGPDAVAPFSMLSATTSLTKMPKMFTTGIKIGDSLIETNINKECGTSTNEIDEVCKTIVPRPKSVGIVIKDSPTRMCERGVECYTMTPNYTERSVAVPSEFIPETVTIKSVCSPMKIEDSGSELCSSIFSSKMNFPRGCQSPAREREVSPNKISEKSSLCCGGVQVHSYREKQESEDVMYQGEWQRCRPRIHTRKKQFIPIMIKRTGSSKMFKKKVNTKDKTVAKREYPETKNSTVSEPRSSTRYNGGLTRIKQSELTPLNTTEQNKKPTTKIKLPPVKLRKPPNAADQIINVKVRKPLNNVTKVSSKHTMSHGGKKVIKSSEPKKPLPTSKLETKNDELQKPQRKNYIPLYLRKSARRENKQNSSQTAVTVDANITVKENAPPPPELRSKSEFNLDLLEFQTKIIDVNYLVLRNEIDNNESASEGYTRNVSENRRAISPQSQNSSTCSSPNSIATVRAARQSHRSKNIVFNNRRHSASSHITYPKNSDSEDTTPTRNKRYTKRSKSAKTDDRVSENKENVPQTSRQFNANKGSDKFTKSAFVAKKKVFIAQLKESSKIKSSVNVITTKTKHQKSNMEMIKNNSILKKSSDSFTISNDSSQKSDISFKNQDTFENLENTNMVLVLEPHQQVDIQTFDSPVIPTESLKIASACSANHRLITDWIDNNTNKSVEKQRSYNLATMRQLIEETLDFIDSDDNTSLIDSETVILSSNSLNINYSPTSFKTVVTNEDDSIILQNELEQVLNRSFGNSVAGDDSLSLDDAKLTSADLDMLSFKSITSLSKFSEYLSADNLSEAKLEEISSMQDIYERKEPLQTQNTVGPLASQAFSGFTINEDTVAGDQPDPCNTVDSETGSMAVDINRQVTSEELFISGRSSGSFQSCLLDEDAVVPNWLFQVISQQQSATDELQVPAQLVQPVPVDEDIFDVNGNIAEGVGVGAGAGDGRGIHSDHSQDSSGRGTSVTSTDTSSGSQSESIIIDPSAFVAQFELLSEDTDSTVIVIPVNGTDNGPRQRQELPLRNMRQGELGVRVRTQPASSRIPAPVADVSDADHDADVSSTDTDLPDSSDN